MNIVGVRTAHHSANSMYKDDNKISRQQKALHMNKMLENVPHFQTNFTYNCVHPWLSIDQLFIFGIFEHKCGTRKHIDDLKKYSWCIPVLKEIKPIIWGAAITPKPWNRQQCWFIFEDPNVRVARLSKITCQTHGAETTPQAHEPWTTKNSRPKQKIPPEEADNHQIKWTKNTI